VYGCQSLFKSVMNEAFDKCVIGSSFPLDVETE
jgi:hypothetical protein